MRDDADTSDDSILKADTRSRVRTPSAKREQILTEFDRSGLSGARFARLHGINYQTLMAWTRKRRACAEKRIPSSAAADPIGHFATRLGLREVRIGADSGLEVEIGGGVRLHIATPEQADLAGQACDLRKRLKPRRTVRANVSGGWRTAYVVATRAALIGGNNQQALSVGTFWVKKNPESLQFAHRPVNLVGSDKQNQVADHDELKAGQAHEEGDPDMKPKG